MLSEVQARSNSRARNETHAAFPLLAARNIFRPRQIVSNLVSNRSHRQVHCRATSGFFVLQVVLQRDIRGSILDNSSNRDFTL